MSAVGGGLLSGLNVPLGASHVSTAGEDLTVVQEATAGEVTGVTGQFTADLWRRLVSYCGGGWLDIVGETGQIVEEADCGGGCS